MVYGRMAPDAQSEFSFFGGTGWGVFFVVPVSVPVSVPVRPQTRHNRCYVVQSSLSTTLLVNRQKCALPGGLQVPGLLLFWYS
jgi:hypothetical protein